MRLLKSKQLSIFLIFVAFLAFGSCQSDAQDVLEIGSEAPFTDVGLKAVSGEMITLNNVRGPNGLLVIFSCNTCPWVKKWEDRYNPISNMAEQRGIGMVALNPNEGFRNNGDSFEDMVDRAQKQEYSFFYAMDNNHKLADAFGASRTPEVFLFDRDMKLVYHGAIDDNAQSAENVENAYLKQAISNLANKKDISPATTKSLGCSIKRVD